VKSCSWCDNSFKPTVSYQIYCSASCREQATKEKIVSRYYITKRNKRKNKSRLCAGCGSSLSIYNDEKLCNLCSTNKKDVEKTLKKIKAIFNEK
jgi:hypothetical protein